MTAATYPKRLIEVDLPIKRISAHARREKSIRHGHISTLHIWWARRPLAACRAVICAALWPDPADELCPQSFRAAAAEALCAFAEKVRSEATLAGLCKDSWTRWRRTTCANLRADDPAAWSELRYALLDFIADFANWDSSRVPAFLEAARALTQAAHESLGGAPGTRPLVVDPFAGGGAIPLEAMRVGSDTLASDLNPVAVLLNKVALEYVPKYGRRLADEVRKWGEWIKKEAERELSEFYPTDPDGATPIAYVWARTIRCEGPGCGAEVPLMRSFWLARKRGRSIAIRMVPNRKEKTVDFEVIQSANARDTGEPTVRRGSATCPCCGFTTPVASVRKQLKGRAGGGADARLLAVATIRPGQGGRFYRVPQERDLKAVFKAATELEQRVKRHTGALSLVPDEVLDVRGIRHTWAMIYGLEHWGDLFIPRQTLALVTIARLIGEVGQKLDSEGDSAWKAAVLSALTLSLSKEADLTNALCRWKADAECPVNMFGRQAIPMVWDFAEAVAISESSGSWSSMIERTAQAIESLYCPSQSSAQTIQLSATAQSLPDDSANALVTDPPYYDAVPYAYLSDFFYVWLRRCLAQTHPDLFSRALVPKDQEIVVDRPHELSHSTKDITFYERELTKAFAEGRRVLRPDSIGTIVFASKTTASWEAFLKAIVDAGLVITGSWPIDTEMETRVAAQGQARLASSVHLVCRPRENPDGSLRTSDIGDWRDVLAELPVRIHDWMPRLTTQGVVGADAIFACLGPALEVYSRYSQVERANGERVELNEYLEHVWSAVAREALTMIFEGADTAGFEEDARLTAIWLWTLSTGNTNGVDSPSDFGEDDLAEDEGGDRIKSLTGGYVLEYDAARKIAQGLGAHLDKLSHIVQIKGDTARLLSLSERIAYLFSNQSAQVPSAGIVKRSHQLNLFAQLAETEEEARFGILGTPPPGSTVLDRVHQAMILFGAGRSEALRRFLVEDGTGKDSGFWRLAQALSALYPKNGDEKRWVDGVLARKKSLGF